MNTYLIELSCTRNELKLLKHVQTVQSHNIDKVKRFCETNRCKYLINKYYKEYLQLVHT